MTSLFALVDCNNFYASCERAFRPELNGVPVVILSNNDGCIIARSNEAKAVGIKMGEPAFKARDLIEQHQVQVFSSNYTYYGDMSSRVMSILATFTPNIEVYSIDESFLDLGDFYGVDLVEYSQNIRKTVLEYTSIPISVGVAQTKTLAKVANRLAKKSPKTNGVLVLTDPYYIQAALKKTEVGDVWGIGRQLSKKLMGYGMYTAWDLSRASDSFVKKHLTVTGLRTAKELRGEPCIDLEEMAPPKQNICTSRSFGHRVTTLYELQEATANYAARCASKLRRQKYCAGALTVFVMTNQFANDPQYYNSKTITLPVATNSTLELVHYAGLAIKCMYKDGYRYKKSGVIVSELRPENQVQGNLLDTVNREKHQHLMQALDTLNNRYGKDKIVSAAQGTTRPWHMKSAMLSPCYTTRLSDLPEVW